jgi:hypothetical protein
MRDKECEIILAERAGFEPATEFYPCDGLANRCLRPLGHLSVPFLVDFYALA